MDKNKTYQEFNEKNSIYHLIYNYIVRTMLEFNGKKIKDLSKNNVQKFIKEEGVILNYQSIKYPTSKISDGDRIEIPSYDINFICQ